MMTPDPKPEKRIRDPEAMRRYHLLMEGEPCQKCEIRVGTQVHHRRFRSQGGSDVPANWLWLCPDCHRELHGLN